MIEANITLATDLIELNYCQQAVSLLMSEVELDRNGRDKVAMLLGFLSRAQANLGEVLEVQMHEQQKAIHQAQAQVKARHTMAAVLKPSPFTGRQTPRK